MVEAKSLSKTFMDKKRGRVRAVDGVSFRVNPGEVVALLGPNGAGKTTTMRLLSGLLIPDQGEALLAGKPPKEAKALLGFLPADSGLYHRLTPREVLSIFGRLSGLQKGELVRRIGYLSERLGLSDFVDTRIARLSTGMRQRVAVARCLVHNPPILIMDEPTKGLDVESARAVEDFILEMRTEGRAILVSTHIMEEAEFMADRVIVIAGGRLVAEGTISILRQTTGKQKLREVYLALVGGFR
ncbi:MAG: ABC transporter ATP-binding protein [candidate division WOR-3 bacterium]